MVIRPNFSANQPRGRTPRKRRRTRRRDRPREPHQRPKSRRRRTPHPFRCIRPIGRFHKVHLGRCPFRTFRCQSGDLSRALDRFTRVPLPCFPSAFSSLFAEGSSFSGGAEKGIWAELFGSFTNLPAWFVSGSSSSSMETLYDVFHCRMSQILQILRNKEGEPFSKHQASIVYVS